MVSGDGADLVFVDVARVVEQTADQGRLAVVHAAGGAEAKQVFGFLGGKKLLDGKDCLVGLQALGRFGQGGCASCMCEVEACH